MIFCVPGPTTPIVTSKLHPARGQRLIYRVIVPFLRGYGTTCFLSSEKRSGTDGPQEERENYVPMATPVWVGEMLVGRIVEVYGDPDQGKAERAGIDRCLGWLRTQSR